MNIDGKARSEYLFARADPIPRPEDADRSWKAQHTNAAVAMAVLHGEKQFTRKK